MNRTGRCACGAIQFEIDAPFIGTGACHCTNCQKASGGGANYVALAPKAAVKVLSGKVKTFQAEGDSGSMVGRAFCGNCGTPLWGVPAHEPFLTVKLGVLDESADLAPQMHIFTKSAPSWHFIDDKLPTFPEMPPAG